MKVGIMTFPNSTSFGAALQMYALYRAVEELGAQAEIINYHNAFMMAERHTGAVQKADSVKKKLRLWARHLLHHRQRKRFQAFEQTMGLYPRKPFSAPERLRSLAKRYEAVICGSDQVWNPDITGNDLSYFLDFCGESTRRISYAPSFGITEFPEAFQRSIQAELAQFYRISAREVEGQQLLQQLTDRQIPLVLDPTFLLSRQEWEALEKPHPAGEGEYILFYTVSRSQPLLRFCLELAEKEDKQVVIVGGNAFKQLRRHHERIRYAWDLDPRQWLYLLHHAQCVVTNSFHGTAFSIHYGKDFFLELSSGTNSRLEQIIRSAGLESRVVRSGCDRWEQHIDYEQVNRALSEAKVRSVSYLKESIR